MASRLGIAHHSHPDHPVGFECCPQTVPQEKTKIVCTTWNRINTSLDRRNLAFIIFAILGKGEVALVMHVPSESERAGETGQGNMS